MAGIPCVIISGMNKSAAYDIGGRCDRKSMGAQWNAVYVNDDWRFLDAFWASACVVGRKSGEWTLVDSDGNVTQVMYTICLSHMSVVVSLLCSGKNVL